tara:strand:+ start:56911 stop:57045 length:135 start_codon:yes stop_codon:yes gene_type:complete
VIDSAPALPLSFRRKSSIPRKELHSQNLEHNLKVKRMVKIEMAD